MKVKQLILLGMTVVPLLSVAQRPCLFNKGKMSIVGTGTEEGKTVLFVDGDFIISRDETDEALKSDILVSNSRTVVKGDFIQNAKYVSGTNATGFTETTSPGVIVFNSTTAQQNITTELGYSSLRKGANYINFPTIEVNNPNGVNMSPLVASKAQGVNLTKGKLILDSRILANGEVVDGTSVADDYSILAHLEVPDGKITYNRTMAAGTTVDDLGVVEVRLKLDPETKDNGALIEKGRSIVGMGSPFKQIASDYFMWNYLMFPYQNNLAGRLNYTEVSPNIVIPAGRGFVTGIDLRGNNIENYLVNPAWSIVNNTTAFDARAKDGYTFNRFEFNNLNNVYPLNNPTSGIKLGNSSSTKAVSLAESVTTGINPDETSSANSSSVSFKPYTEELVLGDVTVPLVDGFNYLANPFTAPLDVTDILKKTSSDWGVTSGEDAVGFDIYNSVWVLNPSSKASATHNLATNVIYEDLKNSTKLYVSYSYLLMKEVGSTYDSYAYTANNGTQTSVTTDGTIAPLQMFLVYANNARTSNSLKIPASKRKITQGSLFLRSTPTVSSDDFLFEVRDLETGVFDRVATVLRTPDEIKSNAGLYQDAPKLITSVNDASDDPLRTTESSQYKSVTTYGSSISSTLNSVLYLLNDEGTTLESKIESTLPGITKKRIPLYLSPSQTKQKVAIRVGRLNTMDRVEKIILEDKLTSKKVEISTGEDYITQVSPTDAHDRFIVEYQLRGTSDTGEGVIDNPQDNIFSYYNEGLLRVGGFEDQDMNSIISVYDIQGRLLNQTKVHDFTMEIPVSLASGAYIVKVLGQRSHVSKFLVR